MAERTRPPHVLPEQPDEETAFGPAPSEIRLAAITEATIAGQEPEIRAREGHRWGLGFWVAFGFLGVLAFLCLLAPWLPFIQEPNKVNADALRASPSADHWFGGDDLGRDVFSRVVWGGRVSLFIGIVAVGLGFMVGGALGLTAGFLGGFYEKTVVAGMDVLLAFPALVLALALLTFLSEPGTQEGSLFNVTLVLTILAIPAAARITRAGTLTFANREFVMAARTLGASNGRIMRKAILPNVIPPLAAFSLLGIAVVIVAEGALSFLGLSVESPTATWGKLIAEGRQVLDSAPHITLIPCAVMFTTLLSFNWIGDQLQRRFAIQEAAL